MSRIALAKDERKSLGCLDRKREQAAVTFAVENPEIEEVLDRRTGEHVASEHAIGRDYAAIVQLRLELQTGLKTEDPRYVCSLCGTPVYLVSRAEERRFFFRHALEDGRCSAHTRGQLSQDEIDARKYNGAKESEAHRRMKEWVRQCLESDPRFSQVQTEATWKGALGSEYRRPDVRARFGELQIAFEIQLSTTYLNVIAARRHFYLQEGGLLFWIFARFDAGERRLTQDDVFFNNNRNAFVVNAQTVEKSLQERSFHLQCIWAVPRRGGDVSALHRNIVSFHSLTLEPSTQRAYYFNFDGASAAYEEEEASRKQTLRDRFESFWLRRYGEMPVEEREKEWDSLRKELRVQGVAVPRYSHLLPAPLLNGLYSAKHGQSMGWRFSSLVQAAHRMAAHTEYLVYFRAALAAYKRGDQLRSEDRSRRWEDRVRDYKAALKRRDQAYAPDRAHERLIEFLFPEVSLRAAAEEWNSSQHRAAPRQTATARAWSP